MKGRLRTAKQFVQTGLVLCAAFVCVVCLGTLCTRISNMTPFQSCLIFLGSTALLVSVWAVRSLVHSAVSVGREIRVAVEGLEAFWGDPDVEGEDPWQEWAPPESGRRLLSRDRVGEPLCPCGSGKPYTQCCGMQN